MAKARPKKKAAAQASSLVVRLDQQSKRSLAEAAELRRISVSDYVRAVTVAQARREVQAAKQGVITLTPEEQLAFWEALDEAPRLTPAQRKLGAIMRGDA